MKIEIEISDEQTEKQVFLMFDSYLQNNFGDYNLEVRGNKEVIRTNDCKRPSRF